MARQLRLGYSACFLPARKGRKAFNGRPLLYGEHNLPRYFQEQGALTYMLPPIYTDDPSRYHAIAEDLDGLVLVGGVDVSPSHYGEKAQHRAWRGDKERDRYEMALFAAFRRVDKPIFGICRGMQLINVALGGSLYQDISTHVSGSLVHRDGDEYEKINHPITMNDSGLFARLYGARYSGQVNSIHHQAIKALAPGLRIEAHSPHDGIIEAISLPRFANDCEPNCFAVQWHPEFHTPHDPNYVSSTRLLEYFMEAMARAAATPLTKRTSHA